MFEHFKSRFSTRWRWVGISAIGVTALVAWSVFSIGPAKVPSEKDQQKGRAPVQTAKAEVVDLTEKQARAIKNIPDTKRAAPAKAGAT